MSVTGKPVFIEHPNGRLYQIIEVDGYPLDASGKPCKCVICDDEQTIEIASFLVGRMRGIVLAEALGHPLATGASWHLVPVRGTALTGAMP